MITEILSDQVGEAVFKLLEDLSTPRSLAVKLLIDHGEWDQLAKLTVVPEHYDSPYKLWADTQATDLLRKFRGLPTSFNRKAEAVENFYKCELSCFRANERLNPLFDGFAAPYERGVSEYFARARKIVRFILGRCPSIDSVEGRFGPGSTFGDRGLYTTVPDKMSSDPTITPDAWPVLSNFSGTLWNHSRRVIGRELATVRGNRFLTVPKDSTKDRGIAVEPSLNVFYQLAYGQEIRRRLARVGLDLSSGQDKHRALARCASLTGHLATIDLSNASDTICSNLVKLLLPATWFRALDGLRSKFTLIEGKWVRLEKFSSMGNGFTFELETLIFFSLCLATLPKHQWKDVSVYGDDIIIPVAHSRDVMSILEFCGLSSNRKKTFDSGWFRESCGGDFFRGEAVRPYFLKESPDEPQQLIAFANGLRRSCNQDPARWFAVNRAWNKIVEGLPLAIRRCRGPQGLGDLLLHDDETRRWSYQWGDDGIRRFRCYLPVNFKRVAWRGFAPEVVLASAILGVGTSNGGVIPRNGVSGYGFGWVPYS